MKSIRLPSGEEVSAEMARVVVGLLNYLSSSGHSSEVRSLVSACRDPENYRVSRMNASFLERVRLASVYQETGDDPARRLMVRPEIRAIALASFAGDYPDMHFMELC